MKNKYAEMTDAGLIATIDFHEAQTRLAREMYIKRAEALQEVLQAYEERVQDILQSLEDA